MPRNPNSRKMFHDMRGKILRALPCCASFCRKKHCIRVRDHSPVGSRFSLWHIASAQQSAKISRNFGTCEIKSVWDNAHHNGRKKYRVFPSSTPKGICGHNSRSSPYLLPSRRLPSWRRRHPQASYVFRSHRRASGHDLLDRWQIHQRRG